MRKITLTVGLLLAIAAMGQTGIDFEKITHWTGTGPNRGALVVQFDEGSDPHAYVWGYRWEDGVTPTGEDMFKAVCANSKELVLLTQYTGSYGATVCGIGYGNADRMLDYIYFDLNKAKDYEFISFDYYSVNSMFGQAEAPGDNTPAICQSAIDAARDTHVIQHPIDARAYGYPAYDYDCWMIDGKVADKCQWASAWYEGYWSYWLASDSEDGWMYSGVGFTGRQLKDGAIDAWSFTRFDEPQIGGFGEGTPPTDNPEFISYRPAETVTAIDSVAADDDMTAEWYTVTGVHVVTVVEGQPMPQLQPGVYMVKRGATTGKILVQ